VLEIICGSAGPRLLEDPNRRPSPDHLETALEDVKHGFEDDRFGHLGGSRDTLHEDDRNFLDAQSLALDLMDDLDLECIATQPQIIQLQLLQRGPPIGPVSSCGVMR
jgi:hypothetical protein